MEKNNNIQREKLFDGIEKDLIKLSISFHDITFKLSDILNNQLRNLIQDKGVNLEDLDKVLMNEDFEKKGLLIKNFYKGTLEVYYLIDNGQIYFFSFGEFQPTRFILYLEAVYFI